MKKVIPLDVLLTEAEIELARRYNDAMNAKFGNGVDWTDRLMAIAEQAIRSALAEFASRDNREEAPVRSAAPAAAD